MRLAGTCSRYSNSAIPQLTSAATYHGLPDRLRKCAYHAKVMNTFDAMSPRTVRRTPEGIPLRFYSERRLGVRERRGSGGRRERTQRRVAGMQSRSDARTAHSRATRPPPSMRHGVDHRIDSHGVALRREQVE